MQHSTLEASIDRTELELKALVLQTLVRKRRLSSSSILANEITLGRSGVRADLAILGRSFMGIEVKSNRDSLRRLENQIDVYHHYFESVLLVVGERHLSTVRQMLLPDIEIWVSSGDSLRVERRRPASEKILKPTHELLTTKQQKKFIGDSLPQSKYRAVFKLAFAQKFGPTSQSFWTSVHNRSITPNDLKLLSRFEKTRRLSAETEKMNHAKWERWKEFFASNPATLHRSHKDLLSRRKKAAGGDEY